VLTSGLRPQIGVHGLIINFFDHESRVARNATFLPEVADHEARCSHDPYLFVNANPSPSPHPNRGNDRRESRFIMTPVLLLALSSAKAASRG